MTSLFLVLISLFSVSIVYADSYGPGGVTRHFSYKVLLSNDFSRKDVSSIGKPPKNVERSEFSKAYRDFVSTYRVMNLFDKNPASAWCESGNDNGTSLAVQVVPQEKLLIKGIKINNGYGKTETTYANNNRPRFLTLKIGDAIKDFSLNDSPKTQTFQFSPAPFDVRKERKESILIGINSVYYGKKFNDTCLSEIEFVLSDGSVWPKVENYYFDHYGGCCVGPTYHLFNKDGEEVRIKGAKDGIPGYPDISHSGRFVGVGGDSTNGEGLELLDLQSLTLKRVISEDEGVIFVDHWSDDDKFIFGERCVIKKKKGEYYDQEISYMENFQFDVLKASFVKFWNQRQVNCP